MSKSRCLLVPGLRDQLHALSLGLPMLNQVSKRGQGRRGLAYKCSHKGRKELRGVSVSICPSVSGGTGFRAGRVTKAHP